MRDAESVITEATADIIDELMADFEVKRSRMYEMLGDQCSYPKTKVLIRRIAGRSQAGARLIKADMDAMWADILNPVTEPVSDAVMNKELDEAMQKKLEDAPAAERLKENREAIAVLDKECEYLENKNVRPIRERMHDAVEKNRRRA